MSEIILSWTTFCLAFPTILGLGVGVMSVAPPEFAFAKWCFSISAFVAAARLGWWLAIEQNLETDSLKFALATFLLFGCIGILWVGSLRWVDNRQKNFLSANTKEEKSPDFAVSIPLPYLYSEQESQAAPPLSSPIIFTVEYIEQELLWRAEGETEMHPVLSDPRTPKGAALFLRVKAKITAIPTLQVEDIRLEMDGPYDPPLLIDWQPQKVSPPYGLERSFHFEISRSIPFMSHAMKLYARAWDDKNQKNIESTSQIFDVEIRRHARAIE